MFEKMIDWIINFFNEYRQSRFDYKMNVRLDELKDSLIEGLAENTDVVTERIVKYCYSPEDKIFIYYFETNKYEGSKINTVRNNRKSDNYKSFRDDINNRLATFFYASKRKFELVDLRVNEYASSLVIIFKVRI